jgi:signal peptidase II
MMTTDRHPRSCAKKAWTVFVAATLFAVVSDLASKAWAFASIAEKPVVVRRAEVLSAGPAHLWTLIPVHESRVVVPRVLDLTLVLNPGAVFGIGAGKRWFFVMFTGIAVAACVVMFLRWRRRGDSLVCAALGLVLGGGVGNLYDRLVFACVRDFLHPLPGVKLPLGWRWPWGGRDVWPYVSNIADLLLIVGVALLAWRAAKPFRVEQGASTDRLA